VTLSITTFEAAMWTVATTPWGTGEHPHFYKWLGTGGTVSRTANKKLAKLCWPSRTRSPKRLIVVLEPKSGGARPPPKKKFFPALCAGSVSQLSLRTGAPTFKLVPAPLGVEKTERSVFDTIAMENKTKRKRGKW